MIETTTRQKQSKIKSPKQARPRERIRSHLLGAQLRAMIANRPRAFDAAAAVAAFREEQLSASAEGRVLDVTRLVQHFEPMAWDWPERAWDVNLTIRIWTDLRVPGDPKIDHCGVISGPVHADAPNGQICTISMPFWTQGLQILKMISLGTIFDHFEAKATQMLQMASFGNSPI